MLVENLVQTIKVFVILKWGKIIRMFRNREDAEQELTNIYYNFGYKVGGSLPFNVDIEKTAAYSVKELEKIYSVQEVEL